MMDPTHLPILGPLFLIYKKCPKTGVIMSGKKVLTNLGEDLAKFLIERDTSTDIQDFNTSIANINDTIPTVQKEFNEVFDLSREEIISLLNEQTKLLIDNLKITDGTKKIPILESVQELYNDLKYLEALSDAQFQALNQVYAMRFADVIKSLSAINRSFQVGDLKLNKLVAEFLYKPLDYFIGGTNDKHRIYYRFSGAKLLVSNGVANGQLFHEVFRVSSVVNPNQSDANPASAILGDVIHIGLDSKFNTVELSKPTTVKGNLTLVGGELIGTAVRARYGDLAENYITDAFYQAGTLLMVSPNAKFEATINKGTMPYLGVVSDKPGFILGDRTNMIEESESIFEPIVLTGKSPVKVHGTVKAQGQIIKGDVLFPSPYISGTAIAIPFKEAYTYEKENEIKPIGVTLENSLPTLLKNDAFDETDLINYTQLIYSKLN